MISKTYDIIIMIFDDAKVIIMICNIMARIMARPDPCQMTKSSPAANFNF
jgi:hypothetical protein